MSHAKKAIKTWAPDERPREKLLQRGVDALTDAELIAILLGTGTSAGSDKRNAVDLARDLLEAAGDLNRLARKSVAEMKKFKGIGDAKAVSLVAAFELSRRRAMKEKLQVKKITDPKDAADYVQARLGDKMQEVFYVLFLSRNHSIITEKEMFVGGLSATVVDPKVIFRDALLFQASALIVAHNHPSGNLQPSQADIDTTRKLVKAGEALEIKVLDHIIVSSSGAFSFSDQGMISG